MRSALAERRDRLVQVYRTPAGQRVFRYVAQSALTTVFSFAVLGLVYGVLRLWSEVPSVLFANVCATVPSYFLNRNWVWGKSGRSHFWREVVPFWVTSVVGILLSLLTASLARHIGETYFPDNHAARTALVEAANLFAFGVLWIGKFLIFNKLFHQAGLEQDVQLAEAEADGRLTEVDGLITHVDGDGRPAAAETAEQIAGRARPVSRESS